MKRPRHRHNIARGLLAATCLTAASVGSWSSLSAAISGNDPERTYLQTVRELPGEQAPWSDSQILLYGRSTCDAIAAENTSALSRDYFHTAIDFLCPEQIVPSLALRQLQQEQAYVRREDQICSALKADPQQPYRYEDWGAYPVPGSTSEEEIRLAATERCSDLLKVVDKIDAQIAEVVAWQARINAGEIIGTGTHLVGTDISAGRYRPTVLPGFIDGQYIEEHCFWERDAPTGQIVDNSNMSPDHIATVFVRNGEYLRLLDCGYWERIGDTVAPFQDPMPPDEKLIRDGESPPD